MNINKQLNETQLYSEVMHQYTQLLLSNGHIEFTLIFINSLQNSKDFTILTSVKLFLSQEKSMTHLKKCLGTTLSGEDRWQLISIVFYL